MNVTKIPKKTISVIEPKRSLIVNREQYHQRRVAAYCRVSTDSEEQLTSYTNQKKVYTEMIAATARVQTENRRSSRRRHPSWRGSSICTCQVKPSTGSQPNSEKKISRYQENDFHSLRV